MADIDSDRLKGMHDALMRIYTIPRIKERTSARSYGNWSTDMTYLVSDEAAAILIGAAEIADTLRECTDELVCILESINTHV